MEMFVLCTFTDVFLLQALSSLRDETIVLSGHVPWGYAMGWARVTALPRPLAALWLGDVS